MLSALRPVREPGAKHSLRQLIEIANWGSRLLVSANDYRFHRFHMKGSPTGEITRFLSAPRGKDLIWSLNRDPGLLEDKLLFENHFGSAGLPVTRTRALVGPLSERQRDAAGERAVLGAANVIDYVYDIVGGGTSLVLKRLDGMLSKGVTVIVDVRGGMFVLSDGTESSAQDLIHRLSSGTWLVQERVQQHSVLDSYSSVSLNTIRLGTFRRNDGTVDIEHAILRIGVSTAQTDALWSGGMAVPLDVETGAFAGEAYRKLGGVTNQIWLHPETKVPFAGAFFPEWDRVVETAREFARHAGDNVYVGWDIAGTPEGPLFTEGNHNWNISFAQLGSSGMLTDEFLEKYRSETGRMIDITTMPRVRPLAALRELR